jgi:hypothetical protein
LPKVRAQRDAECNGLWILLVEDTTALSIGSTSPPMSIDARDLRSTEARLLFKPRHTEATSWDAIPLAGL